MINSTIMPFWKLIKQKTLSQIIKIKLEKIIITIFNHKISEDINHVHVHYLFLKNRKKYNFNHQKQ